MDRNIEETVKACKGCALAAKAPSIRFTPWPKTDRPWSRIHADFAGPLDGYHYLIIVDSYSKWPEVFRCKTPTTEITIKVLHELFARFGVVDTLVTDNGTQFTSGEFKHFCECFQVKHITTPAYHPRSNGMAERFVDTMKRSLKKARGTPTEKALQQFLQVYRITPNTNTPGSLPPAEVMFARKIKSVFDKLLPTQVKPPRSTSLPTKHYNPGDKVYFKEYKNNKSFWEPGEILHRIGRMVYIIQGQKNAHKRHLNQIRKCHNDPVKTPNQEDVIDILYDTFDLDTPQAAPQRRRSARKRKSPELIELNPKRKKY